MKLLQRYFSQSLNVTMNENNTRPLLFLACGPKQGFRHVPNIPKQPAGYIIETLLEILKCAILIYRESAISTTSMGVRSLRKGG